MFSVEERDALRERVLRLAEEDERVVAGAAVGSLALGGGDRWSDLDLTFAVVDDVPVATVLDDWTRALADEVEAIHLVDVEAGPTTYRVLLLPNTLQFDLSMTPASLFRPAGPRFKLLFGEAGEGYEPAQPVAGDLFGWGVIYALHARVRASNAGASGRPSTTSVRCATTRSRSPACARGSRRSGARVRRPLRRDARALRGRPRRRTRA